MQIRGILARRRSFPALRNGTVKLLAETSARGVRPAAVLGVFLLLAAGQSMPAEPEGQPPRPSARELVREVIHNEQAALQSPRKYFRFVQKETTPKGSETSIRIETPQGEVGKVVSINSKPPSQKRCRTDANSLRKQVTDSDIQRAQKEQTDHISKMMAAIPDAFIFQYAGPPRRAGWTEIKFHPNPSFQPASYDVSLLKGVQGTLWVDAASLRLAKVEGTLFQDVNFGWGFLASIHRGGHFAMQQSQLPNGTWKQTYLQVDFDGSKLVLGQIHIHFKDWSQSFVPLPNPPTLADAVSTLEHTPASCRETSAQETTALASKP